MGVTIPFVVADDDDEDEDEEDVASIASKRYPTPRLILVALWEITGDLLRQKASNETRVASPQN